MAQPVTRCRRCEDCRLRSHHWLHNPHYGDFSGGEDAVEPGAEFLCKHCDAIGSECLMCDGGGKVAADPDATRVRPCPDCSGEGVTLTGYRYTDTP